MSGGFNNMNQMESPDYSGYFLARVVANDDPTKRQRIKVTIQGVLEGDVSVLPWISPTLHSSFGMTAAAGVMQVPVVGSLVKVEFQNGDMNYGLSSGYLHTGDHNPDAALLVNYPNRRGWKDPAGNRFWIDNTAGQNTLHVEHASGTLIEINNAGNIRVVGKSSLNVEITGDTVLHTTGNIQASADGNATVSAVGSATVSAGGSTTVSAGTDATVSAGGDVSISAGGSVNISGSSINLN